jgi:hypothetical protein
MEAGRFGETFDCSTDAARDCRENASQDQDRISGSERSGNSAQRVESVHEAVKNRKQQYGLTKKELTRAAKRMNEQLAADKKLGRLRRYSGNLERDLQKA